MIESKLKVKNGNSEKRKRTKKGGEGGEVQEGEMESEPFICKITYIHTYIHTYMHTYIHTYIHAYMHACMHACMHGYMHAYIHTTFIYTR